MHTPRHDDDHFDFPANGTDGAWNRRQALKGLGLAGLGLAVASRAGVFGTAASAATAVSEIPDETGGPYPGDGTNGPNVLTQSGVVRSDIRPSFGAYSGTAAGLPTTLDMTIVDVATQQPLVGAAVYVWHCDRDGQYSLYGVPNQNYLRGVQVTDANGKVTFTTIFPACYSGRWPHIHFEVYPSLASISSASNRLKTSQWALPADACNDVYANVSGYSSSKTNMARVSLATDNVFSDGYSLELVTATGSAASGYTLTGVAGVEGGGTSTTPTTTTPPTTTTTTAQLQAYVDRVYRDFLGRAADSAGSSYWVGRLQAGTASRGSLASTLAFSTEGLGSYVDAAYGYLLGRAPDASGRSYWVGRLQGGTSPAALVAMVLGSDEQYAQAGGTNAGYVDRVFRKCLARSTDAAGLAYWVGRLDAGLPRADVVTAVYDSLESRRLRVTSAYQSLLGRTPDVTGRDFWAGVVGSQGDITVRQFLAASDEYFAKA